MKYHNAVQSIKVLERLARKYMPPIGARFAKRIGVYPRYWQQRKACERGYKIYGPQYLYSTLFIAGLPKSGTTWLKKMLVSYPGFHELLIPDVAAYELATGGSHDYELPDDTFQRFHNMLVVTKMHVHGSAHNVKLLHEAGVRYVVLYRDLRDVAVSHYFYVRQTPWHPEYPLYSRLALREALLVFAERTLLAFAEWVRSWEANRDPELSLIIRYEDMLADTVGVMIKVATHFGLDRSRETIQRIVDQHSFQRLSGGRSQGQQSTQSFFRKGVAGDWQNHFTPEIKQVYKMLIGDFLIEFGYESDMNW